MEITDDIQSSKVQSSENTEQKSKKKKKKHREEHSLYKTELSKNDSEIHNTETKDKEYTKKKKHKNSSEVNEDVAHREKNKNSENHEKNTSNLQEHRQKVDNKNKNQHNHEESARTMQATDITGLQIQNVILSNESTIINGEGIKKKKKKHKIDGFTVERVQNQTPSKVGENKNNLKRKLDLNNHQVQNKKKKNKTFDKKNRYFNKFKPQGFKNKQSNDISDNPLNKLSDERLKAYGLNPKRYRSFLKYKKF